jgi:hypothetical protein
MARKPVTHLVVLAGGSVFTRCGIRLSDSDTTLTYDDKIIETTHFWLKMTCQDCRHGTVRQRPKLRVVK